AGAAGDDRALTGKPDTHLISFVMEKSRGGGHRQPDDRRPATTDPGWGHSMVKASFSSAAIEDAEAVSYLPRPVKEEVSWASISSAVKVPSAAVKVFSICGAAMRVTMLP